MSVREREALERWCPFTRAAWARPDDNSGWITNGSETGFNRALVRPGGDEHSVGNCIGSECMAWRTTGSQETTRSVEMVGLEGRRIIHIRERVGYCGLAGSPGLTDAEIQSAEVTP